MKRFSPPSFLLRQPIALLALVQLIAATAAAADYPLPSFTATRLFVASQYSGSIVVADFNNDGKADVAEGNYSTNVVSVLIATGNGHFAPPVQYVTGNSPWGLTAGDFNNDNKLDLVIAHQGESKLTTLFGNGDGTFQAPIDTSAVPARSVAAGDFNKDGKLDVVTTYGSTRLWLGTGDGHFQAPAGELIPIYPSGNQVKAADLNNDQNPDLVVASSTLLPNGLTVVLIGHGDGTFDPPATYLSDAGALYVALADFNQDERPDIVVGNFSANTASVYLNHGDGTFDPATTYAANGTSIGAVAAGDFDHDGLADFAVVNVNTQNLSVYHGRGDGGFEDAVVLPLGVAAADVDVGDIDGDGWQDLAGAKADVPYGSHGWVLLSSEGGLLQAAPRYQALAGAKNPAAADLDGDGLPELIIPNGFTNKISVFSNEGDGRFLLSSNYLADKNPNMVAVADFNNDGTNDVFVANQLSSNVSLLLGNGDGTLAQATTPFTVLGNAMVVLAHDYTGDHNMDVMIPTVIGGASVYPGNGDGTFGTPINSAALGFFPPLLEQGHLNNDTQPDLVWIRNSTNVAVMLGNAGGTFQPMVSYQVTSNAQQVAVADFNGDQRDDLAVASLDCTACGDVVPIGDVSVLINNGDGTFATAVKYIAGARPQGITAADFNGDGNVDLAVSDLLGSRITFLSGKGDGIFGDPAEYGAGNSPRTMVAGDFNDDGQIDLAAMNFGENDFSVFINTYEIPKPVLEVSQDDTSMSISWPESAGAYRLEQADSPDGPVWSPITETVDSLNGISTVIIQFTGNARYFRLTDAPAP